MSTMSNPYRGFRYPAEIINQAVWLYHCFSLSLREVELILAARGIAVSYETIREWSLRFGRTYAKTLKRMLRKLLKRQGIAPRVLVTDKLASYAAAKRTVMPSVERRQHKGLNNRAENSHQPTRRLDHDRWGHLTLWSAAEQGSCGLGFLPVPHATQGC